MRNDLEDISYTSRAIADFVSNFVDMAETTGHPYNSAEREGKERYKKSQKRYISPIRGEAPRKQISTKFCTFGDMADVIICANSGMEKLRGFGNRGVIVWALPLKRLVTLTTVLRYRTACDLSVCTLVQIILLGNTGTVCAQSRHLVATAGI